MPVGLYATGQTNLQPTLTDDHAAVGHYGTIAASGIVFVLFEPAVSAISPFWSGAAVRWALAVVGTYELSAGRALPGPTAAD